MNYRELGRTGWRVSAVSFGAWAIGGTWGSVDDRESLAALHLAVELGVNFFDTADSYGPHIAEELIAEALYPYPGLVIATKGGLERPGPDKWVENGRPEYLRRQLEGSLRRLKLERIDLWQLHRIDPKVPRDEQFAAVKSLRDEGIIDAKAGYKPSVQAFAGYELTSQVNSRNAGDELHGGLVGVRLSWAVFDGFLTKGKVDEAIARRGKASEAKAETTRQVELQVRNLYALNPLIQWPLAVLAG